MINVIENRPLVKNEDSRSLCVKNEYLVDIEVVVDGKKTKTQEVRERIDVDETLLDMFSYYKGTISDWKPVNIDIPKFESLQTVAFDIETTGGVVKGSQEVDYVNHRITLIGIKNEQGKSVILDCVEDERLGLQLFFDMLERKKPDILYGHNVFQFDIPFIIGRAEILGLKCPFWRPPAERQPVHRQPAFGFAVKGKRYATKRRSTCQINSRAIEYTPVYLTFFNKETGDKKKCAILDTLHEVLAWDFVARKLTNYRLKECPVEMGLIEDDGVVDLPYEEQLKQYVSGRWENGGKELMSKYLESDLNLTQILGNYLFPSIYYQRMFIDWSLQSIAGAGNGSKWENLIESSYPPGFIEENNIVPFERHSFKGAYTLAFAGLFGGLKGKDKLRKKKETCKIDVASLYPTMMLLYGICSSKDIYKVQLAILKWLRNERLRLKDIAKRTGDKFADQLQGAMKILINSGYGSLGTQGIPFNDYEAAALVTAYARGVFRIMMNAAREFGATLVSCFTGDTKVITKDGVMKMRDIVGKSVEVINGNGEWSKVVFVNHGLSNDIYEIKMKRGQKEETVYATGNHRWVVSNKVITTRNLKPGMGFENMVSRNPDMDMDYDSGIVHGIVYGDGYKIKKDKDRYSVSLYGDKVELGQYLDSGLFTELISVTDDKCQGKRYRLKSSINLKELPHGMSDSYLYGFVIGLLATDGTVNKGTARITGNLETLEYVKSICPQIGMQVSNLAISNKKGRITEINNSQCESKQDTYYLSLESHCLNTFHFLRSFHRELYSCSSRNSDWKVLSVVKTNKVENVFCCEEPLTHKFVLFNNCITMNCDTDGIICEVDEGESKNLHAYIQSKLPGQGTEYPVEVELEWVSKAVFVPESDHQNFDTSLITEEEGLVKCGLKKNYIIVMDEKKDRNGKVIIPGGKLKVNGKYRKRDRSKFDKETQPLLVQTFVMKGEIEMRKIYRGLKSELENGTYPIEKLKITRKVRKGEKNILRQLPQYKEDDMITIWKSHNTYKIGKKGQPLKAVDIDGWTDNPTQESINWKFYIKNLDEMFHEVIKYV